MNIDVANSTHSLGLTSALLHLLNGAELDVVFQPIRRLDTLASVGFEALGRATSPRSGAHAPDALLEQAYASRVLLELDRAWRGLAITRIAESSLAHSMQWFFNVDSRCVEDPEFQSGFTSAALERAGIPNLRVVIELGERDPVLDRARLALLMPRYEAQGFLVALDDLGAGHASLNRLVELRPHVAKLDKALIRSIDQDPYRLALVRSLVQFSEEVGTVLIAEGIESERELEALQKLGVPLGQGYLLGRPNRDLDAASVDRATGNRATGFPARA